MSQPTDMSQLRSIAAAYNLAEITCIVAQDKKAKTWLHLFTLIELIPHDQLDSPPIGSAEYPNILRQNANDQYTLYLVRITGLKVTDMLVLYENAEHGISLNQGSTNFSAALPYTLQADPPGDNNLLIKPKEEKTIGTLLPHRHTHCRVWTKINTDKTWVQGMSRDFFTALSELSETAMKIDLAAAPEHIGNVYLFASNPVVRFWECSLPDLEKQMMVSFYERRSNTVIGYRLVLQEIRSDNKGFHLEKEITSTRQRIDLPYFPDRLETRLLDRDGRLIDYSNGIWTNMSINLGIQDKLINYSVATEDGPLFFSVPKTIYDSKVSVGSYDRTVAHYLKDARHERRYQELEKTNEFVFFPKEETSIEKAKKVVHTILNRAHKRCMILDPYFSAKDLVYVFHIENVSVPVQIISSGAFLKQTRKPPRTRWQKIRSKIAERLGKKQSSLTNAEELLLAVQSYEKLYPIQKIECRVLPGSSSPLHDRYIVIDEEVYLLGSSLNEFGNRTTTLIKVPAPAPMIAQALAWWDECSDLKTYCQSKNSRS